VGIIGGGPGGLLTAYFLQQAANVPVEVVLFEASPRLGGKILTARFGSRGPSYEAGAAELYDYSVVEGDPLRDLVAELGLATVPMGGSSVVMGGCPLANLDDVRDGLGPAAGLALAEFDRWARDRMSPWEFYAADLESAAGAEAGARRFASVLDGVREPAARRYVESLIHSDLATEPERTSIAYGLQNYLMNDPAYLRLYSIEGGNEQLPRELAARLRAEVRLGSPVTAVGPAAGGRLWVTSAPAGGERREEFDYVVTALPWNQLSTVHFAGSELAEAMARHRAQYNHPAHYLRITLLFEKPFWRGRLADSYCMLDAFGGCCLYDETARTPGLDHGILGWLLGGQAALEMGALEDAELCERVLQSLPAFLGDGRPWLREGRVHRWLNAVSALPGGSPPHALARRHQPDPVNAPGFFVVGDYLFDSTLNGVLDSADYVASWLAALLTERWPPGPGVPHPGS
jgi:monoamine oxidase